MHGRSSELGPVRPDSQISLQIISAKDRSISLLFTGLQRLLSFAAVCAKFSEFFALKDTDALTFCPVVSSVTSKLSCLPKALVSIFAEGLRDRRGDLGTLHTPLGQFLIESGGAANRHGPRECPMGFWLELRYRLKSLERATCCWLSARPPSERAAVDGTERFVLTSSFGIFALLIEVVPKARASECHRGTGSHRRQGAKYIESANRVPTAGCASPEPESRLQSGSRLEGPRNTQRPLIVRPRPGTRRNATAKPKLIQRTSSRQPT
jgi:hypothetical protein